MPRHTYRVIFIYMTVMTRTGRRNGIFFVTDLGFLLPTLASALEVRRKVPSDRADIRIVTTEIAPEIFHRVGDFIAPYGIELDALNPSYFSGFDHAAYNKTHVPMSTLGRFFMLDAVPDRYDRILYLDGDTWPVGDLQALLDTDLPAGTIGAAHDRNYFRRNELGPVGKKTRAYFSGLGIDGDAGYLSAGVLLTDPKTWQEVTTDAFAFFVENTARCLYHDQSALNAVVGKRWSRIAPQWNYASSYMEWGLKPAAPPQILHFAGGDKPWALPFHPYYSDYAKAFAPLLKLGLPTRQYTRQELQALERRARLRKLRDEIFIHRRILYQKAFNNLVETSLRH